MHPVYVIRQYTTTTVTEIQVLTCLHTFHIMCLSADLLALFVSPPPLKSLAKELSDKFNKGLMSELEDESDETCVPSDDDNTRDLGLSSAVEAEEYYTSQAWQTKVNDTVAAYTNIQHPSKANCSQPLQATTQKRSSQTPPTTRFLTPTLSAMLKVVHTLQWPQAIGFGNSWSGINHSTFLHLAWEQLPTLPPIVRGLEQ